MEKRTRFSIGYVILAFWAIVLIQSILTQTLSVEQIAYSDFIKALNDGRVVEISVTQDRIQGKMRPMGAGDKVVNFSTVRVDQELSGLLEKYNVKFTGVIPSTFLRDLMSWLVPTALFIGIWFYFIRRMGAQQGFLSLGKNKAKIYMHEDINVTFDDVAGVDEAKEELQEVIQFLKYPEKFTRIGGKLPRGILLIGPPGTGKTLLAKAVAGESNVPFFSMSGSEFVEMFVGLGAARVRDLFKQASEKAPCIIFIDELDALGKARSGVSVGGHDEREQTLNQLLVEMDGFDPTIGVILMAATNRPEILDPALLRPGRFDRQVLVDRPDKKGREAILAVHIKGVVLAKDVDIPAIAGMTPGFAGADLANLVNEAALLAVRRDKTEVGMEEFREAVERVVAGLEKKNRLINEHERQIVAYHEIGHALVGMTLPGSNPVQKITIVPRGVAALGYTLNLPTEDRFLMTKSELLSRIAMSLGGRAAEEIVFQDVSTGAHNDLSKATEIARAIVKEYGMDESMGHVYLEPERTAQFVNVPGPVAREKQYSEQTAREIDQAISRILEEQYARAKGVLEERRAVLEEGANMLLSQEKMLGQDLEEILRKHGFTPVPTSGSSPREE